MTGKSYEENSSLNSLVIIKYYQLLFLREEEINTLVIVILLPFFFSYARTAYCDVTGRESRLPLRIRGDGAGPKMHFSLDALDIGNVFVNSQHSYEVLYQ